MNTALNKKFFSYVIPSILAFALSGVYTIVDGFFIGQSLGDTGLTAITLGYPISALIGAVGTGLGPVGSDSLYDPERAGGKPKASGVLFRNNAADAADCRFIDGDPICFCPSRFFICWVQEAICSRSVSCMPGNRAGRCFSAFGNRIRPIYPQYGRGNGCHDSHGFRLCNEYCFGLCFRVGPELGNGRRCMGDHYRTGRDYDRGSHFLPCKKERILPAGTAGVMQALEKCPDRRDFALWIDLFFHHHDASYKSLSASVRGRTGSCGLRLYRLYYRYSLSAAQGVGDGSQPLISQYYGRDDRSSVQAVRKLAYLTAAAITAVCTIGVYLARAKVGTLFGASAEANAGVIRYLPLFLATLLFLAFVRITTSYFYATEKNGLSYLLVYAEPVCTLLMLLILPPMLKLTGVWLATPVAQVITFVIAWAAKQRVDVNI